jgi:hypothetical protein
MIKHNKKINGDNKKRIHGKITIIQFARPSTWSGTGVYELTRALSIFTPNLKGIVVTVEVTSIILAFVRCAQSCQDDYTAKQCRQEWYLLCEGCDMFLVNFNYSAYNTSNRITFMSLHTTMYLRLQLPSLILWTSQALTWSPQYIFPSIYAFYPRSHLWDNVGTLAAFDSFDQHMQWTLYIRVLC